MFNFHSQMINYNKKDYYKDYYLKYSNFNKSKKWIGYYYKIINKIIPQLLINKDIRILEIGSAFGGLISNLNDHDFVNVTGSDMNDSVWNKNLPNVFKKIDITNVITRGNYELLLAFDVFEHIDDFNKCILGIKNILHPGGYLLFSVPYPSKFYLLDESHINIQPPYYFTNKLNLEGLKVLKIYTFSFFPILWRLGIYIYIYAILHSLQIFCYRKFYTC